MPEVACPQCGHDNPSDANFCSVCGAVVDGDDAQHTESHEAITPEAGETVTIVVVRGANAGSRFAATDTVTTIGRHPDSTIFLDDVTVSRRHAEIHRTPAGYELVDAGSLNGTYVNGSRIDRLGLAEGDQLQVGKYKLVVVVEDDEDDAALQSDDSDEVG